MDKSFHNLKINPDILKSLDDMGFETPTTVQSKVIPHILNRQDLIVISKTGSGKTAAFGIPMIQITEPDCAAPQGLILTPTRELAVQVDNDLKLISKHLSHRTAVVYGQHNIRTEVADLKRNPSIITGTPGRVFDHIQQGNFSTKQIRFLVLDEADRMLDMGFIDQVFRIIKTLPRDRVTLLFSATIPPEIQQICRSYMKSPETIEISSDTKTVDTIQQLYYRVERNEKRTQLGRLLIIEQPESCMIFCNTRMAVDRVQDYLSHKGYSSQALHGDIAQSARMKTILQFKKGTFHILVATDVASRGLHVDDLSLVINYDVPNEKSNYVHRIGRTGRAGNGGRAITLVSGDDIMSLYEIEEYTGAMIEEADLPGADVYEARRAESAAWLEANKRPEGAHAPAPRAPGREGGGSRGERGSSGQSGGRSGGSSRAVGGRSDGSSRSSSDGGSRGERGSSGAGGRTGDASGRPGSRPDSGVRASGRTGDASGRPSLRPDAGVRASGRTGTRPERATRTQAPNPAPGASPAASQAPTPANPERKTVKPIRSYTVGGDK